jgi:hypothetical protein
MVTDQVIEMPSAPALPLQSRRRRFRELTAHHRICPFLAGIRRQD